MSYTKTEINLDVMNKLAWIERCIFPSDWIEKMPAILLEVGAVEDEEEAKFVSFRMMDRYKRKDNSIVAMFQDSLCCHDDCESKALIKFIATF